MNYLDERFADIQLLRYRLNGFEQLSLLQKRLVYCLAEATLWGRDITFDQNGRHNLRLRRMLEAVYTSADTDRDSREFHAMEEYLKRLWFASGIHHHYSSDKFQPQFTQEWLWQQLQHADPDSLPLGRGETLDTLRRELFPVIFDPDVLPKRVNKADGQDLLLTSACNFYQGVTQQEAEDYYQRQKADAKDDPQPVSYGLNSTLVKDQHGLHEEVWHVGGRYGDTISHIVYWLEQAAQVAENPRQQHCIQLLVDYYRTGSLRRFNDYCIEWVREQEGRVDFVNGFIEVYGDPLGLKGTWEGIVEYRDLEATRRTQTISRNAQWFEDHSPVDPRFRKPTVKGVTANAICAAMLGGEEYPSTAIGINLPNADWIRAEHGSKSITITNITDAYNRAARGNGFKEEFIDDTETRWLVEQYGDQCDELHTDLHECLGHGSGQLLPGTDPDALKAYGNTIEEARADLFGLYYMADPKLVELGLLPNLEAHHAHYYTYLLNGLMTQLTRIEPGRQIEEAHMRNRALISRWCLAHACAAPVSLCSDTVAAPASAVPASPPSASSSSSPALSLEQHNGKTYLHVSDYAALRRLFAQLLAEIQRIKSEGDYEAARQLVERYAVDVDPRLHQEVLDRYRRLNLAPYKGFINPVLRPVYDTDGQIADIVPDYSESYADQMLRYSRDYSVSAQFVLCSDTVAASPSVSDRVRLVKQSFRQMMDGAVAKSMRDKGLGYHLNWGATLPRLQEMAATLGKDYELAIALWKEDVRECKILATLVMPPDEMLPGVCDIWMEQMPTQEIAEQAAFNLWQHLPYAPQKAYEWMASDKELYQLCGFHVMTRIFMRRLEPNERGISEYLDQALAALQDGSLAVRKAALQSLQRFAELGLVYQRMAKSAAKSVNLDIF